MKRHLLFFCVVLGTLNIHAAFAAPSGNSDISPEKAKEIFTFPILGASMSMSMGEIKTILEGQGFTVQCGYSDCNIRAGNILYSFSYRQARYDRTPLDASRSPENISYRVSGDDPEKCKDVTKAIAQFCTEGADKFPCQQKGNTVMMGVHPRMMSSDGWKYTMNLKKDPSIQCNISVNRQKMKK